MEGIYDKENHIGPLSRWQDDINAELMIVGQDWGGDETYNDQKGMDKTDRTNKRLLILLKSVDFEILPPEKQQPTKFLFFTNSVLCLREGSNAQGYVRSRCFKNCSIAFLRPQVELVNPKVVVTLGSSAYGSLVNVFGKGPPLPMREAVIKDFQLNDRTVLVPVYHPMNRGRGAHTEAQQIDDWKRVRKALNQQQILPPNT
jgi:DNA polymerase